MFISFHVAKEKEITYKDTVGENFDCLTDNNVKESEKNDIFNDYLFRIVLLTICLILLEYKHTIYGSTFLQKLKSPNLSGLEFRTLCSLVQTCLLMPILNLGTFCHITLLCLLDIVCLRYIIFGSVLFFVIFYCKLCHSICWTVLLLILTIATHSTLLY